MAKILKQFFARSTTAVAATDDDVLAAGSCHAMAGTYLSESALTAADVPPDESDLGQDRLMRVVLSAEQRIQESQDAWRQRWERDAVRLACRIASRCLRELPFDSAALAERLVEESLRGLRMDGSCEVRLNPEDYRALTAAKRLPEGRVMVLPDSDVERGGCVVRTPDGIIDQTFDQQLRRIEHELLRE
ncbi:MAG: hypothetical protein KDB14_18255 [Planctomycetales bacterium]|nr:hypothetical protein [Planctomycetales bacterium]